MIGVSFSFWPCHLRASIAVWQRLPHALKHTDSSVACFWRVFICCVSSDLQSATQIDSNSELHLESSTCIVSLFPHPAFSLNVRRWVNQVKGSELLYITLVMFLVGRELCFGWAIENTVEKNDLRIFRVGISLKWQEGRGLQRAFLEAWIIFYFQNRDALSLSAKCQPTCWRKRQGFGKNIMIYIHPSPVSTPQMTPGNSWAKSKCVDSHCRKSHVVAFSSSLSFSLNHTVPTFLQLKAALWITAPFSNVPLVFPEQKRLHT